MTKSPRNASRCRLAVCAVALLGLPLPAAAQQIVISGVVVDSAARSPVPSALVTLGSGPRMLTDANGAFRFLNQRAGVLELKVEAVGYASYSETLTISGDTSVTIVLPLKPIAVDTLQVNSQRVKIEGWITGLPSGKPVIDASVVAIDASEAATERRQERTKRTGYFEFADVQTQLPFDIRILAFGYEPVYITLVPLADATLNIQLRPDTMIERLLAGQVKKLEQRSEDVVGKAYAIDRSTLLSQPDGMKLYEALDEVIQYAPFRKARGPTCYIVDELPVSGSYFGDLYPEEVHRVEVFTNGRMNMIRVYTRDFMADMITSKKPLKRPGFKMTPRGFMGARTPVTMSCY